MLEYDSRIRAVLVSIGVLLLAFVLASLAVIPAALIDPRVLEDVTQASRPALTVYMVANFLGFVLAGGAYLRYTGLGTAYIDLEVPDRSDILWIVGGFVVVIAYYFVIGIVATVLDLPAADSDVILLLGEDTTMILIMMAIVVLFNAPAEEFLFRNVIQKRLYEAFGGLTAVVVASVIFVLPHLSSYAFLAESPVAIIVSLGVIFGGSLVMGYAYLRTENLLVPIGIHAGMNLFQLLIYLLTVIYGIDRGTMSAIVLGW